MEFMGHSGPDHRARISFFLAYQTVEQEKPKRVEIKATKPVETTKTVEPAEAE